MSTFMGYPTEDGAGTREYLAVIASVICATSPVKEITARVPGAVAITHQYGCAQVGDDIGQTRRTLAGVAANPNVAAALIVGLGCETNQAEALAKIVPAKKPIAAIGIQSLGGSANTVAEGVRIAEAFRREFAGRCRVPLPLRALRVGVLALDTPGVGVERVCRAVGKVVDTLAGAGATLIGGLTASIAPAGARLSARARTEPARRRLEWLGKGLLRRRWALEGEPYESVRPWSAEERERALSLVELFGTSAIEGLLEYGERPAGTGLHVMPLPANPVEALSGLVAAGANALLIASGRGVATGVAACPVLVAAPGGGERNALDEFVDHWVEEGDVEREGERLLDALLAIASGKPCAAEREELADFGIAQVLTAF